IKTRVLREIRWNSFPGSVIHGVLGMHLKNMSCVVPHRNCVKCYLKYSCPYGIIYESPVPPDSEKMKLYPQIPHPIRIAAYPWRRPRLNTGEEFEVRLTLIGKSVSCLLMILMALEKGFSEGLGRKHNGERGRAELLYVGDAVTGIETNWKELGMNYSNVISASNIEELAGMTDDTDITISFLSPAKIVTRGKANFEPGLRDIMSPLLRRLGSLYYFHGDGEAEIDFSGVLDKANGIECDSEFKKVPAIRYSGRQSKTISISGFTGEMRIENCPGDIIRYLKMGQFIGLGKSTTMGLGDYILR
ncbi:MAG: CRISPR system precrRNA processing endoribonuclease RAMP protein Cas6, partial [candidate division Zixibacteria bacterium]|nr:CRISPR system precrRNA processing endoribonuclease RAMP protein Cas6 [candidate division Zixibacteria bacterium]